MVKGTCERDGPVFVYELEVRPFYLKSLIEG